MSHKPQLFSGARGLISYRNSNGVEIPLAIATDISVNTRDQLRPTYVVGELGPITLEPLAIDVDCSIGRVIPMNASNAAAKPSPVSSEGDQTTDALPGRQPSEATPPSDLAGKSQATAMDIGLEERINQILTMDSIEISIKDKITGATIAVIKEARFAGRTMSVNSGDVAQERLNFVGIYDGGYGNQNTANDTGYQG